MKLKKFIALAIFAAGTYKIGETVGKLKGSLRTFKYILKQHPELDGLTCRAKDGTITIVLGDSEVVVKEENGDESETEEQETEA